MRGSCLGPVFSGPGAVDYRTVGSLSSLTISKKNFISYGQEGMDSVSGMIRPASRIMVIAGHAGHAVPPIGPVRLT